MAALSTVLSAGVIAHADPVTKWKGAPETDEEDRVFKINGRVMYDVFNINDDGGLGTTNVTRTATRRAFLGVEGRLTQNWRYNVKFDLNPDGGGSVKADDFYIEYAGSNYSLFIGQNNAIAQMENRDSSLTIPFNERSGIANAFAPNDKQMGLAYLTNGGNWSLGAGVYGDQLQTKSDSGATANEASEERVRATFAPIWQRTPEGVKLLHVGAYARHRDSGQDAFFSYKAIPNTNFAAGANNITMPGPFSARDDYWSVEFAGQYNAFGIDGEYGQLKAKRGQGFITPTTGDPTFKGGYIGLYWSPTGESRNYNAADGSFKNIVPFRTLGSDGGIGHLMLSARYDTIDLTDHNIDGGKQTSYIGQVTWIPIDHIKFQLDYSRNNIDLASSTYGTLNNGSGKANVVEMRTQIDW